MTMHFCDMCRQRITDAKSLSMTLSSNTSPDIKADLCTNCFARLDLIRRRVGWELIPDVEELKAEKVKATK